MKVSEFIKVLQELPQDMEVVVERELDCGWEEYDPRYHYVDPAPLIDKPFGGIERIVL
jgi:hypothetical protein